MEKFRQLSESRRWFEYKKPDNWRSCDKGAHKKRSLAAQPNHRLFWKKVNIFKWRPK